MGAAICSNVVSRQVPDWMSWDADAKDEDAAMPDAKEAPPAAPAAPAAPPAPPAPPKYKYVSPSPSAIYYILKYI